MSESDPDLYLQFLWATFKTDVQDYQREEDTALIAALRQLSLEDTRDLLHTLVGRGPETGDFFGRMKEKGWRFDLDMMPNSPTYGTNAHGFPIIGSTADFPGGSFSISIQDIARVAAQEEFLQQLFSSRSPNPSE